MLPAPLASFPPIAKSLELWSLMSFFQLALMLLVIGFLLHLADAYYRRTFASFRLKLSGENWGIVFLMFRDGSLFVSFVAGLLLLNLDIMADIKLAVPFVPFATVLTGAALVVKLTRDISAPGRARTAFLWLLGGATALALLGYVFVMEAAPDEWTNAPFWQLMRSMRSNENPALATWSFAIAFPLLLAEFAWLLVAASRDARDR